MSVAARCARCGRQFSAPNYKHRYCCGECFRECRNEAARERRAAKSHQAVARRRNAKHRWTLADALRRLDARG
jgi:predicted sulfurtransferase